MNYHAQPHAEILLNGTGSKRNSTYNEKLIACNAMTLASRCEASGILVDAGNLL